MAFIDPHAASVGLLLPFEGANTAVSAFREFSPNPRPIIVGGNTKISATTSKWGYGSGYFDGSGDYLRVPYASTLSISGDFTLEVWVNASASPPASIGAIVGQDYGSGTTPFLLALLNGSGNWSAAFYSASTSEWNAVNGLSCGTTLAFGVWYHLAISRAGQVYRAFRDGALISSVTATNNPASKTVEWVIGAARNYSGTPFKGFLQDMRFDQYARYTAPFTPPGRLVVPTLMGYVPTTTITGNVIVSGNGGAQLVVIRDVATRELIATAVPNAMTGSWTANIPPGDYDISYFAPNCQPICHGPYTVTA